MKKLQERIAQGEVIILDGATGTELERRGVPMHGEAWSAAALYTHPEVVRQAHEDYIRAGADIIITNTFASARHTLERTEMAGQVRELNTRAVTLQKKRAKPQQATARSIAPVPYRLLSGAALKKRAPTTGSRPRYSPRRAPTSLSWK